MTKTVFCLMGPTASGKTAIACELVQRFPFEIISVDSAMIYRGMDIGTAKPDKNTLAKAPHHLIDIIEPTEAYSAAQFCSNVEALITEIEARNKCPLLVGGTMMYFNALQNGLSQLPKANVAIRDKFLKLANENGWDYLHRLLQKLDPVSAARIHPHDSQRIQRALEVYELTGKPLSAFFTEKTDKRRHRYVSLLLLPENRTWLHERIALRFNEMLEEGFLNEVKTLLKTYELSLANPSMRCVGYRQAYDYLHSKMDYKTFCEKGIAATRQLAKRQLTWLRHWPDGMVFTAEKTTILDEIIATIGKMLDNT